MSPIILGHSMGGKVAMEYCLRYDAWLSGLIVVDMAPVTYEAHRDIDLCITTMQGVNVAAAQSAREVAPQMQAVEDPGIRAFLMSNLVPCENGNGMRWRFNLDTIAESMDQISGFGEFTEGVEVPTLFVAGARSKYVRNKHESEMQRLFPESETVWVPDAGHWVHIDQPQRFIDICVDFVAACVPDEQ